MASKWYKAAGAGVLLLFIVYYLYQCPFYTWIGIPCPGCNFRSAFFALLRGDWSQSLYYHAMLIPTLLLGLAFIPASKKQRRLLLIVWIVLMLGYYIWRMVFSFNAGAMVFNQQAPVLRIGRFLAGKLGF